MEDLEYGCLKVADFFVLVWIFLFTVETEAMSRQQGYIVMGEQLERLLIWGVQELLQPADALT